MNAPLSLDHFQSSLLGGFDVAPTQSDDFSTKKINLMCFKSTGCSSDIPHWIGDGWCDDENNNESCGFDGGDCCGPNVDTQYCTECICY